MPKLPNKEFRQLVELLREDKEFYEDEEPRRIFWSEYTLSQIKDAKETLKFIRDSVDKCGYLKLKGKVGKPLTDPKDLAKAVLICEALGFPERIAQGWIEILGSFAGIKSKLDDRTIGDAYDKVEVAYILRQVFEQTKQSDGILSGDGTGLERSRRQNYESSKSYGEYMTSIVDSREIVQAFDITGEQECKAMHNLVEEVKGDSLRLDAGFNDRELTRKIAEKEMIPYIFPKRNNNLNGDLAWKTMYLSLFYDVMAWLTEYHKRSHCESFHSSFKRKNKILMKIRPLARLCQVMARIILHNRRRLAYFSRLRK
jgi:transposase